MSVSVISVGDEPTRWFYDVAPALGGEAGVYDCPRVNFYCINTVV